MASVNFGFFRYLLSHFSIQDAQLSCQIYETKSNKNATNHLHNVRH